MATKVCLIIHSLQAGGMERVMAQLASFLSKKDKVKVHLVLYGSKREVFYELGNQVTVHRPFFAFSASNRARDALKTLFFIRTTLKSIQPDSILSFGEMWNNLVLLAVHGLNHSTYVSDRASPARSIGLLHSRLREWLYPKAKGLIVQTSLAKEFARESGLNKNIIVIGNPIRLLATSGADQENVVLSVGRLIATKHYDQLIRLFARINLPTWKLVIVGGDAQRQNHQAELTALIAQLGVSNKVFLEGTQSAVDHYYRKARVFAFASSSEGFPNVIGEALGAGLPVIAFDCPAGPDEMIEDGRNGFLVPVFDYAQFEHKLRLVMEDAALRECMAVNTRANIGRFSIERVCEQFHAVLSGR